MGVIDPEGYDAIVARIRAEMHAGRVVYVHCWGEKGRTSTVVGCLPIDDGMDYDAAIARIAELREGRGRRTRRARNRRSSIGCCGSRRLNALSRKQIDVAHHS